MPKDIPFAILNRLGEDDQKCVHHLQYCIKLTRAHPLDEERHACTAPFAWAAGSWWSVFTGFAHIPLDYISAPVVQARTQESPIVTQQMEDFADLASFCDRRRGGHTLYAQIRKNSEKQLKQPKPATGHFLALSPAATALR